MFNSNMFNTDIPTKSINEVDGMQVTSGLSNFISNTLNNRQAQPVQQAPQMSMVDRDYLNHPSQQGLGNTERLIASTQLQDYRNPKKEDFYNLNTKQKVIFGETGGKHTDHGYGIVGHVGDKAGLTGGAYQFTEKSGHLQNVAKLLGLQPKTKYKSEKAYINALSNAMTTDVGKAIQDKYFQKHFVNSVDDYIKRKRAQNKIQGTPEQINHIRDFLVDTKVNGGYLNVIKRAKRNGDYTIDGYKQDRIDRYNWLVKKEPYKKKFLNGWLDRVARY